MTKTKVMTICPGDDVNIHIKANFPRFTILKIEAIEIDSPYSDDINLEL